jgi:hypothetical protein
MRNHQVGSVSQGIRRRSFSDAAVENHCMLVYGRSDKCAVAVVDLKEDRKFCADALMDRHLTNNFGTGGDPGLEPHGEEALLSAVSNHDCPEPSFETRPRGRSSG